MRYLVPAALILAGIIHLLPLMGVLGAGKLASMYGVTLEDPSLVILMRHRAVLFGMLGLYLVGAGFVSAMRGAALAVGLISAGSFLALAWSTGGYNPQIARVVMADVVAVAVLLLGAAVHVYLKRRG